MMSASKPSLPPVPNPLFKSMTKAVGVWSVSGGLQGTFTFEWKEGGLFLVQHIDVERDGRRIAGMEIVGPDRSVDGAEGPCLRSRFYSYPDGVTIPYTYEPSDVGFTVWMGEKGSPSFCRAVFSEDGNTLTGRWTYPDGGYDLIATRRRAALGDGTAVAESPAFGG